jgi:hypothetical protein
LRELSGEKGMPWQFKTATCRTQLSEVSKCPK